MANPHGNLSGFADPSVPGWQKRVLDKVKKNQKRTKRNTERTSGVLATFDEPFRELLEEAARRKGISRQGFARRAIGAFIAYELGMDIEDVVKHSARPLPYGKYMKGMPKRTEDDATGFGPWKIVEAEEL